MHQLRTKNRRVNAKVTVPQEARKVLEFYLAARPGANQQDSLFISRYGKHLKPQDVFRLCKRLAKQATIFLMPEEQYGKFRQILKVIYSTIEQMATKGTFPNTGFINSYLCKIISVIQYATLNLNNIFGNIAEKTRQNSLVWIKKIVMVIFTSLCTSTIEMVIQNLKWRLIEHYVTLDFKIYEMLLATRIRVNKYQMFLAINIFYCLTIIKKICDRQLKFTFYTTFY